MSASAPGPAPARAALDLRPVGPGDRAAWEPLWLGYLRFYRARLGQEVTDTTFARLIDPADQPHGLLAWHGGRAVGLVQYLYHRHSWSIADACYLQDLYVAPEARGLGAGRALIHAVYAAADAAGSDRVYWMTQEYNSEARALYDTLARRTSFIRYQR